MSDNFLLRELYQEVIIDHNKNPRHFYVMEKCTHQAEGYNPLCGDQLMLYLFIENNVIKDISFKGQGCAISTASASLMTETLLNKSIDEAKLLFQHFHELVTQENGQSSAVSLPGMEKLKVLRGVQEFPSRVKCATLAWHTLNAALNQQQIPISTE